MNLYVDFDRTLYNTDELYNDMFKVISSYGITREMFDSNKNVFFDKPVLFNYIKLIKYMCNKYNISFNVISDLLIILENGKKYLYDDSYNFLSNMKKEGYDISLLTYGDINFQMLKLTPLNICDIIDNIIISSNYKFQLNLNYNESIFIDDNPRDLIGLSRRGAKKVIRIKRENSKYCNNIITDEKIPSFSNLRNIIV